MNYLQAQAYIESLSPTTGRPFIERMQLFCQEHDLVQDSFPSIHIGGTNGKGSTTAMAAKILECAGKKVGRFTGPHLLNWNERIAINSRFISQEAFASLATRLRAYSEDFGKRHPQYGALTWFELLTAMAFFYFREENVDFAVIEVGLGGKFDATNVLTKPKATVITNVTLDHEQFLGSTLRAIALEKSGIIKANVPVVTAARGEALAQIAARARAQNCPLYHLPDNDQGYASLGLLIQPDRLNSLIAQLALYGEHQKANALLALAAIFAANLAFGFDEPWESVVERAFSQVWWPGRMQFIPEPGLILDGAHNPAGALALRQSLDSKFGLGAKIFVLASFASKDVSALVQALLREGDLVFASEPATKRDVHAKETLCRLAGAQGAKAFAFPSIAQALQAARKHQSPGEFIVCTGSFATVRECMMEIGFSQVEDGKLDLISSGNQVKPA